jgi:hypothetical protein
MFDKVALKAFVIECMREVLDEQRAKTAPASDVPHGSRRGRHQSRAVLARSPG